MPLAPNLEPGVLHKYSGPTIVELTRRRQVKEAPRLDDENLAPAEI